jgi:hypothetical protein
MSYVQMTFDTEGWMLHEPLNASPGAGTPGLNAGQWRLGSAFRESGRGTRASGQSNKLPRRRGDRVRLATSACDVVDGARSQQRSAIGWFAGDAEKARCFSAARNVAIGP